MRALWRGPATREGQRVPAARQLLRRLNRLREKAKLRSESARSSSGAKARVDSTALMARLKSCPFKTTGTSAACKVPVDAASCDSSLAVHLSANVASSL